MEFAKAPVDTCKWMHLCKHSKAWMCTKLVEMAVFIVTFHPAILQKLRNTKEIQNTRMLLTWPPNCQVLRPIERFREG